MADVKILKGLLANLPSSKTEGKIYFARNGANADGRIYLDYDDSTRLLMADGSASNTTNTTNNSSNTLYLVGATAQNVGQTTYSRNDVYLDSSGWLHVKGAVGQNMFHSMEANEDTTIYVVDGNGHTVQKALPTLAYLTNNGGTTHNFTTFVPLNDEGLIDMKYLPTAVTSEAIYVETFADLESVGISDVQNGDVVIVLNEGVKEYKLATKYEAGATYYTCIDPSHADPDDSSMYAPANVPDAATFANGTYYQLVDKGEKMYYVIDDTKLGTSDYAEAFRLFATGLAANALMDEANHFITAYYAHSLNWEAPGSTDIQLRSASNALLNELELGSRLLPLAGGVMTGPIQYGTTNHTSTLISVTEAQYNNAYGHNLVIEGGGATVLAGGEAGTALRTGNHLVGENAYVAADENIYLWVNAANLGTASRYAKIDTSLNVIPDTNNVGSIGTSSYKWASMYATSFYGDLIGNANTASVASQVDKALTFSTAGDGAANGTTYNGSTARKISYNSVGAASSGHTHGNINNNGTITDGASKAVITDVNGAITTASLATSDPTVPSSGTTTATSFIDTISQNSLGQITATKKNVPTASTSGYGITQLSSATDSNSEIIAATPKAVKAAYDLAASKTDNTGTVTSITLKAGTGISLDTDNTAITTSGTRTITNTGVRSATINGNYLRVNTNGTDADLTIPYATAAGKATNDGNDNNIVNTYATKSEVNALLAGADAMVFKGTIGTGGTVTALPDTHNAGWTYKVITAATYAGIACEVGDLIICTTDGTVANNNHWTVAQTNIDGAVVGPSSATSGNIPLFDGTTGKLIKNSTYSPSSFATSGHTHTISLAAGGTSTIDLAASTTYTLTAGGQSVVFKTTPNTWRGIQNNLTSDSTTDSLSAAQGKALANGSARDSTKLPLAGGTMTGDITFTDSAFSSNPTDAKGLVWSGGTDGAKIFYRQTASNAGSLVLQVTDDGEEYINFRHSKGGQVYLKPNTRELYPDTNNTGSLGTTSYRWQSLYSTRRNFLITGTGEAAQDKGSGVSPRYFPAKWKFNTGTTAADGDMYTIKMPNGGHDYGIFMSVDNGAHYYPVILNTTSRLTTHFASATYITVVFESGASAASMFALAGGDSRVTVNGGCFRVINYRDNDTDTRVRTYSSATNVSVPLLGSSSANSTTAAWSTYTGTYKDWYAAIPNDDSKRAKINLSTGAMTVPGGITANVTGNLTGTASKATGDVDGNAIKTTYAKLASPALTGTPTAPTAAAGTNTTQIATTAFVQTALASAGGDYSFASGNTITGNGSATSFAVTHAFDSRDVIVQVYDLSDYSTVQCDVVRTNTSTVTVTFATAPASGKTYRVLISSMTINSVPDVNNNPY